MTDVPVSMQTRGPVTGAVIVTLKAQADMDENTIVTFGTEDRSCAKCGATDFPVGWLQGAVDNEEEASVHLFAPMWLFAVDSTSDAISFGDTLECYAGGKVIRAEDSSGNTVMGKAMQDASAGTNVLAIPVVCCPTYTTS